MRTPRGTRPLSTVLAASLAPGLAGLAPSSPVHAATRSKGQLFVFDSPDCTGGGNAAKVTVPASVGGRDYPPNIDVDLYATDTATRERFGPYVAHTNGNGDFCERVVRARATKWKIELIEPGSGFTDSKVVTVVSSPPAATTTTPTTTPATLAPTTTAASTSTIAVTTTNTAATTTTAAATTRESSTRAAEASSSSPCRRRAAPRRRTELTRRGSGTRRPGESRALLVPRLSG